MEYKPWIQTMYSKFLLGNLKGMHLQKVKSPIKCILRVVGWIELENQNLSSGRKGVGIKHVYE